MKSRYALVLAMVGILATAAVASAAGPGTCGNIPPRDGTGRQLGHQYSFRVQAGGMAWMWQGWQLALQTQFGLLGWGPGDGTGNDGDGPEDGTGYGPGTGTGSGTGTGVCDGTGPHGPTRPVSD